MRYESLLESIGRTPLVRLRATDSARCYAKLELQNPFGHKDRFARYLLEKARATGRLREGDIIIESSSGTLALGLTMVGRMMGHEVYIVTDPRTDALTMRKLTAMGAVVQVVEQNDGRGWQQVRLERVRELIAENPRAFWPMQYSNPDNPAAYHEVAVELLADLDRIDVLVAPVGSGGLLSGTARVLRQEAPGLKVVAVDAVGSVIFGQANRTRRLNGIGNSLVPENVDKRLIDQVHWLSDEEGFHASLRLARDEQIYAGGSSGCAYWAARWIARNLPADQVVAVLFPDRGDRYYQTIFDETYRESLGFRPDQLPDEPVSVAYGTPVTTWSWASLPVEVRAGGTSSHG